MWVASPEDGGCKAGGQAEDGGCEVDGQSQGRRVQCGWPVLGTEGAKWVASLRDGECELADQLKGQRGRCGWQVPGMEDGKVGGQSQGWGYEVAVGHERCIYPPHTYLSPPDFRGAWKEEAPLETLHEEASIPCKTLEEQSLTHVLRAHRFSLSTLFNFYS